jgi:thioredoxin-related protein
MRMKKIILFLIGIAPMLLLAQKEADLDMTVQRGIMFEKGLTYKEILDKVKKEGKYLFLDCFTTWCGPCNAMEKEVYCSEKLGTVFNDQFISVKLQMDTTKGDDIRTKSWYAVAHSIMKRYNINVFPSYLFFAPDGRIVYKAVGYKSVEEFISLADIVLTPDNQYSSLLDNYRNGDKDYSRMESLAQTTLSIGDEKEANGMASDYINNFLFKLPDQQLYTQRNISFIATFTKLSTDVGFSFFYKESEKIDSALRHPFSKQLVDYIISREEIYPNLWLLGDSTKGAITANPVWKRLSSNICRKYNKEYEERTIINAQLEWYNFGKNWNKLAKIHLRKISRYGFDTTAVGLALVNNIVWSVFFEHVDNRRILKRAIKLQKAIVALQPNDANNIDTYANLLYKVGRIKEALTLEEKSVILSNKDNEVLNSYKKMKSGEPTWSLSK